MLGIAERGPVTATLLTSFGDYQRAYGSYVKDANGSDRYLAYAVEGFFQNGGLRCFAQRVVHWDPVKPANSAQSAEATAGGMTVTAIGPGAWGNNVAFQISNAGLADPTLFKLTVLYWTGSPSPDLSSNSNVTEVFDNLSAVPSASTFYESEINNISNLIVVKQMARQTFEQLDGEPGGGCHFGPDGIHSSDRRSDADYFRGRAHGYIHDGRCKEPEDSCRSDQRH